MIQLSLFFHCRLKWNVDDLKDELGKAKETLRNMVGQIKNIFKIVIIYYQI